MSQPSPGFKMPAAVPQRAAVSNQPHPGQPTQLVYQTPQPQQQMLQAGRAYSQPVQLQPAGSVNYVQQSGVFHNTSVHSFLSNATSFHVKQKIELAEIILQWETANQYTVYDQAGNIVFYVGEESDCCTRQICGARRPFRLNVKDVRGQSVFIMDRTLDCSFCYALCCPDEIRVTSPDGQLLGSVNETFGIFSPSFAVRDANRNNVLTIDGPLCPVACGPCRGSIVFDVLSLAGTKVGTISKEWSGWIQEIVSDADNFNISFPLDVDPTIKAVLLAALFLIDYEYFEKGGGDQRQGGRRLLA